MKIGIVSGTWYSVLFTGDQAGCVQTQKSECKGAEGHNPPRTESLGGTHKWVILFKNDPLFLKPFFLIVYILQPFRG